MSHFSVLVTGDDVEGAMAPYDENLEVPRYMRASREQLVAESRKEVEKYAEGYYSEFLADPEGYMRKVVERSPKEPNLAHIAYLAVEFPKRLTWTDDEHHAEAIRWTEAEDVDDQGNEWSESNPVGYWDYWRVGGRWARHLALNPGEAGHSEPLSWEWTDGFSGDAEPNPELTHADTAKGGHVDWDKTKPTFAIVHDGHWISRGEMGWFGMLRSEECPEDEWPKRWREVVDSLPVSGTVTVVDCHV